MKTDNPVSLREAAKTIGCDRATLRRLVENRGLQAEGQRLGHPTFRLEDLRRIYDLEYLGHVRPAAATTCDECWGFLSGHRGGKPCPPGSYAEGQWLDARWHALSLEKQRRLLGGGK
jgi:hypothetical protein